jgi:UDP-galactopyranose mutase
VINYTEEEVPYTRSIEHKHFEFGLQQHSIVSFEYPVERLKDATPAYPVCTPYNLRLHQQYKAMADKAGLLLGGRLACYRYLDMDDTILSAMLLAESIE